MDWELALGLVGFFLFIYFMRFVLFISKGVDAAEDKFNRLGEDKEEG